MKSNRRSSKSYTVYEVLADGANDGPAADGTSVHRFRDRSDADTFARSATCYGRPASVSVNENVPRHLAQRWGCA